MACGCNALRINPTRTPRLRRSTGACVTKFAVWRFERYRQVEVGTCRRQRMPFPDTAGSEIRSNELTLPKWVTSRLCNLSRFLLHWLKAVRVSIPKAIKREAAVADYRQIGFSSLERFVVRSEPSGLSNRATQNYCTIHQLSEPDVQYREWLRRINQIQYALCQTLKKWNSTSVSAAVFWMFLKLYKRVGSSSPAVLSELVDKSNATGFLSKLYLYEFICWF
jgi:hypothetical protein